MDVENSIRLARAYAAKNLIWFSTALYRCRIVLTDSVPIAAIDKNYNTYWNPQAIQLLLNSRSSRKKVLSELGFIWVHEISHVLREHHERADYIKADATKWNYAADLEINDSNWEGLSHPTLFPPVTPDLFDQPVGRTAEWYYNNLPEDLSSFNNWDDGSGVHGFKREWELEDKKPQELTDISRTVLQRQVARDLKSARPGRLPGGWVTWIKNTLEPKVDWKKVLRNRLSTAITIGRGCRIDYTFSRPNRRASIYSPIVIPSLTGTQSNQLIVVIDTSGSMTGLPLEQAVGELYSILRESHRNVKLIPCDAQEYEIIELKSPTDIRRLLKLPGGGGTNMIKGIEYAVKQTPIPDTILVLTDGYTLYPTTKYNIPVLFGIIGQNKLNPGATPPNPPWGLDTHVFIDLAK